jgi:4-hydroxy-4-methyl-2-oxoglutarate aldolase
MQRIMGTFSGNFQETFLLDLLGDVQVRAGDIIVADINGVVVIPLEKLDEVLAAAEEIQKKEEAMVVELKRGVPILEVDRKHAYEAMLKKE